MRPESLRSRLMESLRSWLSSRDADEEFVAAATDLADLERRLREVERRSGGLFITFNH